MPRKKPRVPPGPSLFPDLTDAGGGRPGNGEGRRIPAERLPTNTTTRLHPIHRWFNFIAGFSPEFVHECCRGVANQDEAPLFLDPFTGCATGPLVAWERGMRVIGYEPHPFFCRIARAKLGAPAALVQLEEIEGVLSRGFLQPQPLSLLAAAPATFLRKLFADEALTSLLGAREALTAAGLGENPLAFLVLSRVLEKSSHAQTDGIYKAPTTRKAAAAPVAAFRDTVQMIRGDLDGFCGREVKTRPLVHQASAEDMRAVADDSVSLIVTSPPYLNNFDFAEMTRMYLYFWGWAASWGEITDKVRSKLIVNTTTALKGHKDRQERYRSGVPGRLRAELDEVVAELAARRAGRAGKKEYDLLVYPYFSQLTQVLRECCRCLRRAAALHLMVADAALYGVHIRTPQILAAVLQELGFHHVACSLVRKRGQRWILSKRQGAEQGLGEYHVSAIK